MDFYNITLPSKIRDEEISSKYGKKFGILKRLQMGGNGSPRLFYLSGLQQLDAKIYLNQTPMINFEVLEKSIYIHFHLALNTQNYILALFKNEISDIESVSDFNSPKEVLINVNEMNIYRFEIGNISIYLACKSQVNNNVKQFFRNQLNIEITPK